MFDEGLWCVWQLLRAVTRSFKGLVLDHHFVLGLLAISPPQRPRCVVGREGDWGEGKKKNVGERYQVKRGEERSFPLLSSFPARFLLFGHWYFLLEYPAGALRRRIKGGSNREPVSLRSKRFQSSYCAQVRASFLFFCSRPNFLDELGRKRLLRRLQYKQNAFLVNHFPLSYRI